MVVKGVVGRVVVVVVVVVVVGVVVVVVGKALVVYSVKYFVGF